MEAEVGSTASVCGGLRLRVRSGSLGDMQECVHVMFGERPEILASLPSLLLTRIQSAGEICILNSLISQGAPGHLLTEREPPINPH